MEGKEKGFMDDNDSGEVRTAMMAGGAEGNGGDNEREELVGGKKEGESSERERGEREIEEGRGERKGGRKRVSLGFA